MNCTCVVLDSLLDFPGGSAPGSDAVGSTAGVFPTLELPEPESEASLLFAVGLGLPELVRLSTVSSTSFSMNWTCGICAVF